MNHDEELKQAAIDYADKKWDEYVENILFHPASFDLKEAFLEGAKKERELVLKMIDDYVDRMTKDIPKKSYDYEEGLKVAFKCAAEWLRIKIGQ